jgi:hypothetical protein
MGQLAKAAVVVLVAALSGCASAPPSPLGKADVARLRLDQVTVAVAPDATVNWANAEDEFAKSKAATLSAAKQPVQETGSLAAPGTPADSQYAALIASPEAKAYVRERVAGRVKAALEETVKPALNTGTQAVRLEVTVKSFVVPSAIQRVIVGGQPMVMASIELKDAATGAVLASRPDFLAVAYAGNGWGGVLVDQTLDDLDVRLARNAAEL